MRKLLLTASVIALGAVVTPASAETVRWARASDALTLDPHSQNQGVTHNFNHHIYETLLNRDVEGNLIPRLATEWYIKADDPTVWVFKLREGVKFHGGQDFTAEDVVFSLNRARSDKSNMRQLHADVADVIAVDDLTFAANFIQSRTFRAFEIYFVVTAIYIVLAALVRLALRLLGRWVLGTGDAS